MALQKIPSNKPAFTAKIIEMWRKERGCDIVILCKDRKKTKAHSIVLRSVSDKIDCMLDSTSEETIVSETVSVDAWKSLLEIIYTGASNASLKDINVDLIMDLAETYEMNEILQQLQKYKEELTANAGNEVKQETTAVLTESEKIATGTVNENNSNATEIEIESESDIVRTGMEIESDLIKKEMESKSDIVRRETESEQNENNVSIQKDVKANNIPKGIPKKMPKKQFGTRGKERLNEVDILKDCSMVEDIVKREMDVMGDVVVRRSGRKSKKHFCSKCQEYFATKILYSEHACFGLTPRSQNDNKMKNKPGQARAIGNAAVQVRSDPSEHDMTPEAGKTAEVFELEHYQNVSSTDIQICLTGEQVQDDMVDETESKSKSIIVETVVPGNSFEENLTAEGDTVANSAVSFESIEQHVKTEVRTNEQIELNLIKDELEVETVCNLYCVHCDGDCRTQRVMCLYCCKVATNIQSHFTKRHRYTPTNSLKIYTCQLYSKNQGLKDFMVFIKEPKGVYNQKRDGKCKEEFQYRCSKCSLLFNSIPSVLKHLKLKHPFPKVCVCKTCGCGFVKRALWKDHLHFCGGGALRGCKWCDARFWRSSDFQEHLLSSHHQENTTELGCQQEDSEDEVTFDCSQMQEEQSLGNALSRFETVHVMRDEPHKQMCLRCGLHCMASSVKCHYCCLVINTQEKVKHMKEVHPLIPQSSLWPVDCNKYYKTSSSMPEILSWQTFLKDEDSDSVTVARHTCALCSKVFFSPEVLKKHLSKVHKTMATCCAQCGLLIRSSWRTLSKDHINLCAGGDFVKCRQCGRLCGSFDSAKWHQMKSHNTQYHAVNEARTKKKATSSIQKRSIESKPINFTKREKECDILCIGCDKRCEMGKPVTCRLCLAVVTKDGIHMKENHPHSRTETWVISCGSLPDTTNFDVKFLIGKLVSNGPNCIQFKCLECDTLFLEKSGLTEHVKEHIDPTIHEVGVCNYCHCVFIKQPQNDGAFEDHIQFCASGKLHSCNLCEQRFGSFKELSYHILASHKTQNDDLVTNLNQRSDQLEVPSEKKSRKRRHSELIEYITEYVGQSGEALCVTCGNDCSNETVLCLYCFEVVTDIKEHRVRQHPFVPGDSLSVYSCNVNLIGKSNCDKRISSKEEKHSTAPQIDVASFTEVFDCGTCHQSFSSVENLLQHTGHHYKCLKCRLFFNTMEDMVSHLEGKHSYRDVCICNGCGTGFGDANYYRVHLYYCQGGMLMKCGLCSWLFWKEEDLQEHVRLLHTEQNSSILVSHKSDGSVVEEMKTNEEEDCETKPKRKRLTQGKKVAMANATFAPPPADFEEVSFSRSEEYTKVCFTCWDDCTQSEVQCAYCNDLVTASEKIQHMQETHPLIPPTSLWPVRCKNKMSKGSGPDILSKQVFMSTVLEACDEFEEGTVQLTLTGYECALCNAEIPSAQFLKGHLKEEHSIDAAECNQCGVVIRSSCRVMVKDHLNLCSGGDFVKCKLCGKLCGSAGSAHLHHIKVHASFSVNHTVEPNLPRRAVGEVLEGEQGYKIVCVNCNGTCNTNRRPVKCRLCNVVVPKDDLHMKLKHPFSKCTTWYVTCLYNMFPEKGFYHGQKIQVEGSAVEYQCMECSSTFESQIALISHIEGCHFVKPPKGIFRLRTCEHCEGVFKIMNESYGNFKDHVHFCGGGSLFTCDYCSEVFGFSLKLKRHMTKSHPEKATLLNHSSRGVSIGGRQFVKVDRGIEPIEIPEGTLLQCAECPFQSYLYLELRRHNKKVHGYNLLQLNQLCRFCFRVFKKLSEREKHEQSVHLAGQRFLCEECGTDFEIKSQLQHHVEYHHKGQKEMIVERQKMLRAKQPIKVCPECGETFKLTFYYNQHIKMVHEKSLEYKCHLCGKNLSSKYKLKIHIDRHKGHKPFKCEYCSYRDYTGALVNIHIKKEHPHIQFKKLAVGKSEVPGNGQEVSEEEDMHTEYVIQEEMDGKAVKAVQNYLETAEVEVEGLVDANGPVQYIYTVSYV